MADPSRSGRRVAPTPPPRTPFSHNALHVLNFLSEDDFSLHWILSPVRFTPPKRLFFNHINGFLSLFCFVKVREKCHLKEVIQTAVREFFAILH